MDTNLFIENQEENCFQNFENTSHPEMFKNSEIFLTDQNFVLKCGENSYQISKKRLQEKSPYFEALFNSCMKESIANEIEFHNDVDERALEIVLGFVESSKYPELMPREKNSLLNILALSHLFMMTDLFEYVSKYITDFIKLDDLFEIWDLAKIYNNDVLTNEVIAFMAIHCQELKDTILPYLTVDDMKLLLLNRNMNFSVLDFIICWAKLDIQERRDRISSLLMIADLTGVTNDCLDKVLKQEMLFAESKYLFNSLLKSISLSRLKVMFFTGKKLHVYFFRENNWRTFDFPKFYEPFWNGTALGTEVFIFAGNFNDESVISNVLIYDWEKGLFEKYKMNTVENSLENSTIALLNGRTYFLQIREIKDQLYEDTIFLYDSVNHSSKYVDKITTPFKPSYLVPVGNCLFLFDKRAKHFGVFYKYDVSKKEWSPVPYPEFEEIYYEEKAVCCNKTLHLIRYAKVAATLFWDYREPKPETAIRQMEDKGSVQLRYLQSGIKYVAFSVKKILYRYNFETNDWIKMETTDGPENINTILNAPEGSHCRVPYIFVVGSDSWLYSLNPDNCEWKQLTDLHSIRFHDYRRLLFMMGC